MKYNLLLFICSIFFFSCSKEEVDPCEGIICVNSGVCINGACDCPIGYEGPSCDSQTTPSSMRVTNIRVTQFPATKSTGGGWDITNGADIYVTMVYNGSDIYNQGDFYENANPDGVYDFNVSGNLIIDRPTDKYIVRIYDFDSLDADDYVGGIEFTPYFSSSNGFPPIRYLDAGGVKIELSVEYVF